MKAFLFWYKLDKESPTEYVYIIAYTEKQARYFFKLNGYTRMYDYSYGSIDYILERDFLVKHELGQVLGQYARI